MSSINQNKGILVENDQIIQNIKSSDKKIYSIVLTGGPSAGKSTIIQFVKKYFNKYNSDKADNQKILVLTLNEIATHLINQGVTYTGKIETLFQKLVLSNQISMEDTIYTYAKELSEYYGKIVILMDRGLIDGKAYLFNYIDDNGNPKPINSITDSECTKIMTSLNIKWNNILKRIQTKEPEPKEEPKEEVEKEHLQKYNEHLEKYDLIIHIVTGAQGTGFFYTTENNAARSETATEALELDKKTQIVWEYTTTKPIYILDNREGIICRQGKGVQIIKILCKLLGITYSDIFIDTKIDTNVDTSKVTLMGGYLKYKSKYLKLKNSLKMN